MMGLWLANIQHIFTTKIGNKHFTLASEALTDPSDSPDFPDSTETPEMPLLLSYLICDAIDPTENYLLRQRMGPQCKHSIYTSTIPVKPS